MAKDTARIPRRLTAELLAAGVGTLSTRDSDLARISNQLGPPPMWARRPGFPTLVRIILEQQVSLASARATYEKLTGTVGRLTPPRFLRLDGPTLRKIGFSRQKAQYCGELAHLIVTRRLVLKSLESDNDARAKARLVEIKGIGSWSADIYLLMALLRPDVWPSGDLALAVTVRRVKRLMSVPDPDELERIARHWQPWRAVAARMLWHYYLSEKKGRNVTAMEPADSA
ncbi:MAG: DNA-3-methyladenine glycosylase 2 family protein [Candidatus Krumholzibacteria bacterium]|nr:DNA-3-methyladenine glycosylase 2 family protein [Candidatus Krumholzibacteria bacterium]